SGARTPAYAGATKVGIQFPHDSASMPEYLCSESRQRVAKIQRLYDEHIARQFLEHAFGRAADEDALQASPCDSAHDDEIRFQLFGLLRKHGRRDAELEMHIRFRNVVL